MFSKLLANLSPLPFRGGSGWCFDRQVSVRFVSKNEICYICGFYEKTELIHNS